MINILLSRPSFKEDILLLGDILSFKMSRQIICVGGLKAKYQRDIGSEKRCPLLGNSASPTANRSSVATRAYKKGVERVPASFQRDRSAEARRFQNIFPPSTTVGARPTTKVSKPIRRLDTRKCGPPLGFRIKVFSKCDSQVNFVDCQW